MSFEQTLTIAIITAAASLIFNSILQVLKKNFDESINTKSFKREQAVSRLEGLYLEIYKTIIQSEYVRYFSNKYDKQHFNPIDFPFLEISMTTKKIKIDKSGYSEEIIEVVNAITQEKKDKIIEKILGNPRYSSSDLLKLATAYRYVNHYFKEENITADLRENIDNEEIKLSRLLVMTIIKETNELLETCNQTIDGKEITYGLFNHEIFERDRI